MLTKHGLITMTAITTALLSLSAIAKADITYPTQPSEGPGGSNYLYSDWKSEPQGDGVLKYIIYEPNPKPTNPLPVIAFLHGYSANPNPQYSQALVAHLVKKGNIVIWPYYNVSTTSPEDYDSNAAIAIYLAIVHIGQSTDHAQPETYWDEQYGGYNMNFGLMGHSAGAFTAANVAATFYDYVYFPSISLIRPKVLVCLNPGNGSQDRIPMRDYSRINSDIFMQIIVGTQDNNAKNDGQYIWNNSSQIDDENKDWILVRRDLHGQPCGSDLKSNHYDPVNRVDSHDWYGYWKWPTALFSYAFHNNLNDQPYALGNTAEQRDMGKWSDGVKVIEPTITKSPYWYSEYEPTCYGWNNY